MDKRRSKSDEGGMGRIVGFGPVGKDDALYFHGLDKKGQLIYRLADGKLVPIGEQPEELEELERFAKLLSETHPLAIEVKELMRALAIEKARKEVLSQGYTENITEDSTRAIYGNPRTGRFKVISVNDEGKVEIKDAYTEADLDALLLSSPDIDEDLKELLRQKWGIKKK